VTDYYVASSMDGVELMRGRTLEINSWTPEIGRVDSLRGRAYVVWRRPTQIAEWPCRLFRVEAPDVQPTPTPGQFLARSYRPVEELPGWMTLGPQGEEAVELIARVGRLSPVDMLKLGDVWKPFDSHAEMSYRAAVARATGAMESAGRSGGVMAAFAVLDATYVSVMNEAGRSGALSANMLAMMPSPGGVVENLVIDPKPVATRGLAKAMGTLLAVVMRDIISSDDSELLQASWREHIADQPAPASPRVVPMSGGIHGAWTVLPEE
jgi:hypothetical protein